MADGRKERFRRYRVFTSEVRERVSRDLLEEQYSPVQIVGLARREGRKIVSHTRIYQFIREDNKNGGRLYTCLRHKLKHGKRPVSGVRGIKSRVSIEEHPAVVDERSRFGDWEIDTIEGKDNKGAIVTLMERKTGSPYSSWERGLNEYTNGLVRQYIPKGEVFEKYDNLYIKNVQYKINKRPREKLNFDCPKRLFFALLQ